MGITTVEGPVGSGKTLTLTAFVFKEWKDSFKELDEDGNLRWPKGRPIFATYHLNGLPYTLIDLPKVADILAASDKRGIDYPDPFEGAIVGLDEAYLFFDRRRSTSKGNLLFNALMARSRKLEADFFIAVLRWRDMDTRIQTFVTARSRPNSTRNGPVKVVMRDMKTGQKIKFRFWGPDIYPLYQTGERVPLPKRLTRLSSLDR